MTTRRRPGPQPHDGIKRRTYSFAADPRLVAAAEALVDHARFHSRSEVIEEGLRLVLALHRERRAAPTNVHPLADTTPAEERRVG